MNQPNALLSQSTPLENSLIMPAFAAYFLGLSLLLQALTPIPLDGPLLLGFCLLPRPNQGRYIDAFSHGSQDISTKNILLIAFCLRVIAGIAGLYETGRMLVSHWGDLQSNFLHSKIYTGASPLAINSILAAILVIVAIFIFENALQMVRDFRREISLLTLNTSV